MSGRVHPSLLDGSDFEGRTALLSPVHQDVKFTRTVTKAVQAELDDLAAWLGLAPGYG